MDDKNTSRGNGAEAQNQEKEHLIPSLKRTAMERLPSTHQPAAKDKTEEAREKPIASKKRKKQTPHRPPTWKSRIQKLQELPQNINQNTKEKESPPQLVPIRTKHLTLPHHQHHLYLRQPLLRPYPPTRKTPTYRDIHPNLGLGFADALMCVVCRK